MIFDGWCPDCDIRSAIVDAGDAGDEQTAWATCTECGAGWVWREDEPAEQQATHASAEVRRAA